MISTSSFIDLATFTDLSKELFKNTEWFASQMLKLERDKNDRIVITRSGDILTSVWMDVIVKGGCDRNPLQLFDHVSFLINEKTVQRFEPFGLDILSPNGVKSSQTSDGNTIFSIHLPFFNNKPLITTILPYVDSRISYELVKETREEVLSIDFYGIYLITNGHMRTNFARERLDKHNIRIDTYAYTRVPVTSLTMTIPLETQAVNRFHFAVVNKKRPLVYKNTVASFNLMYESDPKAKTHPNHTSFMLPYIHNLTRNKCHRYRTRKGIILDDDELSIDEIPIRDNVHTYSHMYTNTTNYNRMIGAKCIITLSSWDEEDELLFFTVSKDIFVYKSGEANLQSLLSPS